jgi:hypothetical protein
MFRIAMIADIQATPSSATLAPPGGITKDITPERLSHG